MAADPCKAAWVWCRAAQLLLIADPGTAPAGYRYCRASHQASAHGDKAVHADAHLISAAQVLVVLRNKCVHMNVIERSQRLRLMQQLLIPWERTFRWCCWYRRSLLGKMPGTRREQVPHTSTSQQLLSVQDEGSREYIKYS